MRDFFSMEGSFNRYAGFVADVFILSLLWILFSLPVVTVGASTTAMFYVATRRIANREGYITSDFWRSFKANFFKATGIWLLMAAIIFVIFINMRLGAENFGDMGVLGVLVLPAQIVMLVEVGFVLTYAFPVTARFDMGFRETIKTSFFMANRHFFTSVGCVALFVGLILLIPQFAPLMFLAPGIYGVLASYMIMRVFRKYRPEIDPDPVLELQEHERRREEEKRREALGLPFTDGEEETIIEDKENFEEE